MGEDAGRALLYDSPLPYQRVLTLARFGMLPFLGLLILATGLWVRRWQGNAIALLAVGFLATTPVILGHAAVVALDVPVTALMILSLYALLRWIEHPSALAAACLGLASGLAVATKISAIPFLGIAALTLFALRLLMAGREPTSRTWRWPSQWPWHWRQLWVTAAIALGMTLAVGIAVYGPHRVYLTTPDFAPNRGLDLLFGHQGAIHDWVYRWAAQIKLPLGFEMVPFNIADVAWHNQHGHFTYLLGRTALNGWWYFYPIALLVKTPLPLLILGLSGLAELSVRGWRQANIYMLAPGAVFAAIFLFCCAFSHINIGIRHVLIAYPLLAIGAADLVLTLWRGLPGWTGWQRMGTRAALAALLAWQALTPLLAYPDLLAYFNVLAGSHPEQILVDSDLDWGGQDLRRLERVLADRGVREVCTRWCARVPSSMSPWGPSWTIPASDRARTSSSAPKRPGSRSRTRCPNTGSTW